MATNSPPPPSSPPSAVPPVSGTTPSPSSNTSPPTSQSSPPPDPSTTSPPSLPNANPPDPATPSTPSPPPQPPGAPPPAQNSTPPPLKSTPSPPSPQQSPPTTSPPPPSNVGTPPPPPVSNTPPPSPVSNPPTSSSPPPPPTSPSPPAKSPPSPPNPPTTSPPPRPPANPPNNSTSPPSSTDPPRSSPPPPPSTETPRSSPPSPPSKEPPKSSPPPSPASVPPQSPPPASAPPRSSPPPPVAVPPSNESPPPTQTASPPVSELAPPPSNSSSKSSPPTPPITQLSPPSPSQIPVPPTDNTTVNGSTPSSPEGSHSSNNNGIGTVGVVAISLAAGIIILSLIGLAIWCFRKRRKEVSGHNGVYVMPSPLGSSPSSGLSATKTNSSAPLIVSGPGSDFVYSPKEPGGLGNSRALFTYEELVKATNGFSTQNYLGEGGFGSVYKGYLPDGREVAIKQLKVGGGQGEREFKAEVEIIGRIHHRHLVSLVGYCISESQRLLIYDYVPNNTLHFHLHGEGRPVLEWETRVKIAVGAARGIAYLHEDCHPRIIHRDIKSSNILLNDKFEAQVSDFGLAKLALDANTHITTRVMGTFGYMAPEYASSGKLTEKSDVYSFGVVLLELITGRKPVDISQPAGDESLVEWARPLMSHSLENEEFECLVDPRLDKTYVDSEMFRMIEAAAACVRHSAAKRPRMGQVVRAFYTLAASDLSNGMKVGESEIFNSAQQSAEIRWFQRMAFGSQNYSTDFFTQGSGDN
ncbi:hypothetical protein Ddye_030707 [Dipteronia dyeriana]|uniref:non-specific serine/threonine protein kinase n=1 Tax=Dipteronia dyeriana TaxID=168575 RepID=A0AAD9TGW3_9ROSI|nr:hypothetical protein Ddye_030707 [Dipteronia dyeriana]